MGNIALYRAITIQPDLISAATCLDWFIASFHFGFYRHLLIRSLTSWVILQKSGLYTPSNHCFILCICFIIDTLYVFMYIIFGSYVPNWTWIKVRRIDSDHLLQRLLTCGSCEPKFCSLLCCIELAFDAIQCTKLILSDCAMSITFSNFCYSLDSS